MNLKYLMFTKKIYCFIYLLCLQYLNYYFSGILGGFLVIVNIFAKEKKEEASFMTGVMNLLHSNNILPKLSQNKNYQSISYRNNRR